MSRIARSKARPGMIYVHFGVITLVATAALAWFATSEQQRSQAARVARADTEIAAKDRQDDSDQPSTEREIRDGRSKGGSWGPEPRAPAFDDGVPVTAPRRQRTLAAAPAAPFRPDRPRPQAGSGGIMPEQDATGTLVEVAPGTRQPTPEEIEALLRRSALRAGGEDRPPEL